MSPDTVREFTPHREYGCMTEKNGLVAIRCPCASLRAVHERHVARLDVPMEQV